MNLHGHLFCALSRILFIDSVELAIIAGEPHSAVKDGAWGWTGGLKGRQEGLLRAVATPGGSPLGMTHENPKIQSLKGRIHSGSPVRECVRHCIGDPPSVS